MNYIINDRGDTVLSEGAPCSVVRMKLEYPQLIEIINQLVLPVDVLYDTLKHQQRFSRIEIVNLLKSTKYKDHYEKV